MPTSKHRKKHKAKAKKRRNEVAQAKNAENKARARHAAQAAELNKLFEAHLAEGGKPEDFQPLQELLKGLNLKEGAEDELLPAAVAAEPGTVSEQITPEANA
jgi:hypothetical protein